MNILLWFRLRYGSGYIRQRVSCDVCSKWPANWPVNVKRFCCRPLEAQEQEVVSTGKGKMTALASRRFRTLFRLLARRADVALWRATLLQQPRGPSLSSRPTSARTKAARSLLSCCSRSELSRLPSVAVDLLAFAAEKCSWLSCTAHHTRRFDQLGEQTNFAGI